MSDEAYAARDGIAVVTLDNPPVNGLGHALRSAIVAAVDRANADEAVEAIVLTGAGKMFSAGADIREFGTPKSLAEPTLRSVIATVEAAQSRSSRRSAARRWAAASSSRSAATSASPRRPRRSRCRR